MLEDRSNSWREIRSKVLALPLLGIRAFCRRLIWRLNYEAKTSRAGVKCVDLT
jgi:hypothetical protein